MEKGWLSWKEVLLYCKGSILKFLQYLMILFETLGAFLYCKGDVHRGAKKVLTVFYNGLLKKMLEC